MRRSSRTGRSTTCAITARCSPTSGGRRSDARAAYERIPKNDQRTLRITLAYARHAGQAGDPKLAQSILKAHFERTKSDGHPVAARAAGPDRGRRAPRLLVATPIEGMAEVFYGLGEALTGEGGVGPGAVYLQFCALSEPRLAVRAGGARQRL